MTASITAYTETVLPPPGEFVEFVSINPRESGVAISIRNRKCEVIEVVVPHGEFRRMAREAFSYACTNAA